MVHLMAGSDPPGDLRRDVCLRGLAALLAIYALLRTLPVLNAEQKVFLTHEVFDLIFFPFAAWCILYGLRQLPDWRERAFWRLWASAILFWWSWRLISALAPDPRPRPLEYLGEVLFFLFYLAILVAARERAPQPTRIFLIRLVGDILFLVVLMAYFTILPGLLASARYDTLIPSIAFYLSLDILIAARFATLAWVDTQDLRRRRLHGLLTLVMVLFGIFDLFELLHFKGIYEWRDGSILDFLAPMPLILIILAARLRHSTSTTAAKGSPWGLRTQLTSPLLLSIVLMPILHFAVNALDLLGEATRPQREILVVGALLALGALAALESAWIERRSAEIERANRASEELARHAQKMQAVGQLAGGIAHDFNNLLTVIQGNCRLLGRELAEHPRLRQRIDQTSQVCEEAAGLVQKLLAFGSQRTANPTLLNPFPVLDEILDMLQHLLPAGMLLERQLTPSPGQIRIDRAALQQTVMNLVLNARDAMPNGGKVMVRAHMAASQHRSKHSELVLEVCDAGLGIADEHRDRIFEPFFSTKDKRRGTGLGLATVDRIVEGAGGTIDVESSPGQGSVFRLHFPAIDAPEAPAALVDTPSTASPETASTKTTPRPDPPKPPESALHPAPLPQDPEAPSANAPQELRARRILVVDDETGIREVITAMLKSEDYMTLEACDGREALRCIEKQRDEISLVVSDIVMPELDGVEMARRIRANWPDLPIVLMSAYAENINSRLAGLEDPPFLQKPFDPDILLEVVAEALDPRLNASQARARKRADTGPPPRPS